MAHSVVRAFQLASLIAFVIACSSSRDDTLSTTNSGGAADGSADSTNHGGTSSAGSSGTTGAAGSISNAGSSDGSPGSAGAFVGDASDGSDGTVLYGDGCVYECGQPVLDSGGGCPTPACLLLPLTSLECFCRPERGSICPATIDAALERLRTTCETGFSPAGSRIYHCAGRSVTVIAVNGGLWETDYFFDATGALIGIKAATDTNSGPCMSSWWGAGDVACDPTDECAPCPPPPDAGASVVPACADAGL